ncbi:ArsR family transcriptional regulator [Actinobacteria bacterium YIM 96077]|uniref:Transcriptional regulator n=1 Tax=Phytoactinopolyspora halophila TaxID=1981511 RepID=A0A329R332_9ACTN|nr:metalloregulator ArsR/SmtB family transcription factor [Phytoactinopolyspora halophila]AYY15215.1 ArsR family transcriptional regulator [Actinobacteria bacterium YIM 96077]RAW18987.1 transcriptional regulator [Phytoactinopolyspora halophila]
MAEAVAVEADGAGEVPVELSSDTHDFLKALASPTRQRIMMLFFQGAELSVGEVAERAGLGQSTASEQLALMRRGGMVTARRDGKVIRYRGDRDGIRRALAELQAYLEVCC